MQWKQLVLVNTILRIKHTELRKKEMALSVKYKGACLENCYLSQIQVIQSFILMLNVLNILLIFQLTIGTFKLFCMRLLRSLLIIK